MGESRFAEEIEAARGRIENWYARAQHQIAVEEPEQADTLTEAFTEFGETLQALEVAEEELRQQYEELEATRAIAEAERQRYQDLFELAPDAYLVTDTQGIIREANAAAAALLNVPRHFLGGKPLLLYLADTDRMTFQSALQRLIRRMPGDEWIVRLRPRPAEGTGEEASTGEVIVAVTGVAVRDPRGEPIGIRWLLRDITERKRIEEEIRTLNETLEERIRERTRALEAANESIQKLLVREQAARAQAEAAQRRFAFLAEASALLAGSLDYETTLGNVARLALPHFADWCTVDLLDNGELRLMAVAHVDPAREQMAREMRERYPPRRDLPHGVWHVLRTGEPVIMREVDAARWAADARDAEHRELLRVMDTCSFMRVPLSAHGQTFGVLSVGYQGEHRRYGSTELSVIAEVARRAATAVENARLYQQAREATAARDRFLAILSHELRTPLTPIQATADLLRRVADDPERVQRAAEVIERNARLQASLVNDLLDLSRITQGRIQIEPQPVNLGHLVGETLQSLSATTREAGLALIWEHPAEAVIAEVDPFRMQQVLLNLIHNAIKYTPRGGRITVSLSREGNQACIAVADTGVGISPEALSRIFQIFHQETKGAERKGLGIGLALVSSIVEMHGGEVWAESEGVGRGSRFVVALPVCPAPARPATAGPGLRATPGKMHPVPDRQAGTPGILLVEDNPDSREAVSEVLELLGYEVRETASAEEALDLLSEWRPDLILSDIGLPGISGLELIRQVRADPHHADVPALAITGYGTDQDRRDALAAGFNGHVVKPVEMEELEGEIQALLRERAASKAGG